MLAALCLLKILADDVSTMRVPVDVIVPPDNPNPVATEVTVPVIEMGA